MTQWNRRKYRAASIVSPAMLSIHHAAITGDIVDAHDIIAHDAPVMSSPSTISPPTTPRWPIPESGLEIQIGQHDHAAAFWGEPQLGAAGRQRRARKTAQVVDFGGRDQRAGLADLDQERWVGIHELALQRDLVGSGLHVEKNR